MATQTSNGHAFEYALTLAIKEYLENNFKLGARIKIMETTAAFVNAKKDFLSLTLKSQAKYLAASRVAIKNTVPAEPCLWAWLLFEKTSLLFLTLQPDNMGKEGDVRDILLSCPQKGWEIGFSVKHNHAATKHPRVAISIDFGKEWLGVPCSPTYFAEIAQTFSTLKLYAGTHTRWSTLGKTRQEKNKDIYAPVLLAFRKELTSLLKTDTLNRMKALLDYLLGREDFYKIIFIDHVRKSYVDLLGFNLAGKLNQPCVLALGEIPPTLVVNKLEYPTKLVSIELDPLHIGTLLVVFDKDWAFSFRLHNACEFVENSLKFDIRLTKMPVELWRQRIPLI